MQYELENTVKRYERLTQEDDYEAVREGEKKRPKNKGKMQTEEGEEEEEEDLNESSSLYN